MYIPKHFLEDDLSALHAHIKQNSFGTLITAEDGVPFATHLPVLLDETRGNYGTLRAHVARGNPQWRHFQKDMPVLVMFQGPHTYISPSWYEISPTVPTWNYTTVHAYGTPLLLNEAELVTCLSDLTDYYEAGFEKPWSIASLQQEHIDKMVTGIVGFEIEITRLEGKAKMSQNYSEADQKSVVAALSRSANPADLEVSDIMRKNICDEKAAS